MSLVSTRMKAALPTLVPERPLMALRRLWLARMARRGQAIAEVEIGALPGLVRAGMAVVDVGANIGGYTLELARLAGPGGHVTAIEPLRENCAVIRTAARRRGRLAPIQILEMAACERPGRLRIGIPGGGFEKFYLAALDSEGGETREIEGVSLDALLRAGTIPRPPEFIKIDIEGAELRALRGAGEILRQRRAVWLVEVSARAAAEVWALMAGYGYDGAFLRQGRWIAAPEPVGRQSNFFFFPAGTRPLSGTALALAA